MANYYSNSIDYHNDLDNWEARVHADQAEELFNDKFAHCGECHDVHTTSDMIDIDGYLYCKKCACANNKPVCVCLEYAGDDPECPVHGWAKEQEGSDTSTMTQLNDAGYGCGGIY